MKIVINKCYGGFGVTCQVLKELLKRNAKCLKELSLKEYYGENYEKSSWVKDREEMEDMGDDIWAHKWGFNIYNEKTKKLYMLDSDDTTRTDKDLVDIVENAQFPVNGNHANLQIVEIPDEVGNNWHIDEYDGIETIHENHRSW